MTAPAETKCQQCAHREVVKRIGLKQFYCRRDTTTRICHTERREHRPGRCGPEAKYFVRIN